MRRLIACAAATLSLAACGGPETVDHPRDLGTVASQLVSENGRKLNGRRLNGETLNGRRLNGTTLTGLSVDGVIIGGSAVTGVAVTGTVLSGTSDGQLKRGADFVGSLWRGMVSDGTTVPIRVSSMQPLPAPNADLLGYAIAYETEAGWVSYCGYEPDGSESLAIPMAGLWKDTEYTANAGGYSADAPGMTFACRSGAIGKCVEMGYRPWGGYDSKVALQNYTVACTRMLRADYCGTGVSYTVDGTLIDVYDRLGIQQMTQPDWPIEAEWGPNGARCMAPESISRFPNSGAVPSCYAKLARTGCGESFKGTPGTFIIDRYLKLAP